MRSMQRVLFHLLLFVLLVFVACNRSSTPNFSHASKSAAEFEKDSKFCEEGAEQAYPDAGRFVGGPIKKEFVNDCLRGKGWVPIERGISSTK